MRAAAACVLLGAWLFGSSATAASSARPRTLLLVLPLDPAADAAAARVYRGFEDVLRQSQGFEFVDVFTLDAKDPDTVPQQTRSLLASARQAYDELELRNAVRYLEQALRLIDENPASSIDGADYREALILLGASRILLGEDERGKQTFVRLLSIDPEARLDPALFPPNLTRAFEESVGAARRLGTGSMDIQPSPAGTEVWVDGAFRGTGSVRLSLPEGRHLLRLYRRGCRPIGLRREVVAGAEEVIRQAVEPLPGAAAVMSQAAKLLTAPEESFPDAARELLQRGSAQRMFWFRVGVSGSSLRVAGRLYDSETQQTLRIPEKTGEIQQAGYEKQLQASFSAFASEVAGRAIARRPPEDRVPQDDATRPPPREERSRRPWYATWWFWTATGAVAAGVTGLVLGLTLGAGGAPRAGDVVFRF